MPNRRIRNVALDTNALDRNGTERDRLVEWFVSFAASRKINVIVPGGVRDEVQHPRTPSDVQNAVFAQIFNLRPPLIQSQVFDRNRVARILQGHALPAKHAADASHLSEAVETGCSYFITCDKRIIAKRGELTAALPAHFKIVTLEEFFEIFRT